MLLKSCIRKLAAAGVPIRRVTVCVLSSAARLRSLEASFQLEEQPEVVFITMLLKRVGLCGM